MVTAFCRESTSEKHAIQVFAARLNQPPVVLQLFRPECYQLPYFPAAKLDNIQSLSVGAFLSQKVGAFLSQKNIESSDVGKHIVASGNAKWSIGKWIASMPC